jgi:hypothetical protein
MGNSSSKNDKIIHPKFLGHMPKPWDFMNIFLKFKLNQMLEQEG